MMESFFTREIEYSIMRQHECCGNCRYWKHVFDCEWGMCFKNAPSEDGYPCTKDDGSCDEFCDIVNIYMKKGIS